MNIQLRVGILTLFILMTSITTTIATLGWLADLFGHGINSYSQGNGFGTSGYGGAYGQSPHRPAGSSWTSKFPWLGNKGNGWNWNKGNKWSSGSGSFGNGHGGGYQSNIYNRESTNPWAGISGGYRGPSGWVPLTNRWQYRNDGRSTPV